MIRLSRRTAAAALVALPFCWTGARAQPAPARRATPRQTEGPFYPVSLPRDADADLLRNGSLTYAQGSPATGLPCRSRSGNATTRATTTTPATAAAPTRTSRASAA